MRWLALLFGAVLWALPPLRVVSVERTGLPPYIGSERIYRLEGGGCSTLRVGEILVLKRDGERRDLGRLEVLSVHVGHARARLAIPGETFPLKGDLAVRMELLRALPEIPPTAAAPPIPAAASLCPRILTRAFPPSVGPGVTCREPIYFLKGDASLSPGAQVKLRTWVETWGIEGRWFLECPQAPGTFSTLLQERISTLQLELQRLGVPRLDVTSVPPEPEGRYDAIYVVKEPW